MIKKKSRKRDSFKIAAALSITQASLTYIGWLIGGSLSVYFESVGYWIAFAILLILGIKMIVDGNAAPKVDKRIKNATNWRILIPLSIATSIDALVVGVGFSFMQNDLLIPVLTVGIVTFLLSVLGIYMGKKVAKKHTGRAEIAGGIILIVIGVKIVIENAFY
jgi:putative Mn2+ efflux pump MntP